MPVGCSLFICLLHFTVESNFKSIVHCYKSKSSFKEQYFKWVMASQNAGSDFVWKLENHFQPISAVNCDLMTWGSCHGFQIKIKSQVIGLEKLYMVVKLIYLQSSSVSMSNSSNQSNDAFVQRWTKTYYRAPSRISNNLQCSSMLIFLYWLDLWLEHS